VAVEDAHQVIRLLSGRWRQDGGTLRILRMIPAWAFLLGQWSQVSDRHLQAFGREITVCRNAEYVRAKLENVISLLHGYTTCKSSISKQYSNPHTLCYVDLYPKE
jgi:hypothetical protein